MILHIIDEFSDIIHEYKIKKFRNFGALYEINLQIFFIDKTTLYVRDYLFSDNIRKYSYHWQTEKGECIIRWDNIPHHQNITTFPFHKHIGKKENVAESEAMSLGKVLGLIRNKISQVKDDV